MVNAYMMMRRYCELKGVRQPYNHDQFQEMIGYALISPEEWKTKKRCKQTASKSPPPPEKFNRAPKVSVGSLNPEKGALKRRLDDSLDHLPIRCPLKSDNSKDICQLHRFAHKLTTGKDNLPPGSRANVMYCATCGVSLCLPCYYLFHKTADLTTKTSTILSTK